MALGRGLGEILSEVEEAYEKDLSNIRSQYLRSETFLFHMVFLIFQPNFYPLQ